jgi:hypothetical protein
VASRNVNVARVSPGGNNRHVSCGSSGSNGLKFAVFRTREGVCVDVLRGVITELALLHPNGVVLERRVGEGGILRRR